MNGFHSTLGFGLMDASLLKGIGEGFIILSLDIILSSALAVELDSIDQLTKRIADNSHQNWFCRERLIWGHGMKLRFNNLLEVVKVSIREVRKIYLSTNWMARKIDDGADISIRDEVQCPIIASDDRCFDSYFFDIT